MRYAKLVKHKKCDKSQTKPYQNKYILEGIEWLSSSWGMFNCKMRFNRDLSAWNNKYFNNLRMGFGYSIICVGSEIFTSQGLSQMSFFPFQGISQVL